MIFLPLFFSVLAITSYKYGQFGARQVPYAYYLLGLTTLSVVSNGIATPDQAWQIGIDRTEEILLGSTVALVVSTVLWPRSACEEFVAASRESLETIGQLMSIQTEAYALETESPTKVEEIRQTFPGRLSVLRNLLQAGSMESTLFAARLSNYNAYLSSLISLFEGALQKPNPIGICCPSIDWFWVKVGIKSGLVGVVAITLLKWIQPPGPPHFR
jgi:uncharacterized membrane protein YccC